MANPPYQRPPVQKKRGGLGCLGCGCLVLALLAVLFLGLVGGIGYMAYNGAMKLTSTVPATVPTFDGGDDVYNRARQKMNDFNHDVQNHQAATIHLSADDLNTLLARNPSLTEAKVHLFITLNGNQAKLQLSFPLAALKLGVLQDRYFNGDVDLSLNFEPDTRRLHFILHDMHGNGSEVPSQYLPQIEMQLDTSINQQLQLNLDAKKLLDQAKSLAIQNGELIIETQ